MENLKDTTLGKYEVLRNIGKGAMSDVYLGYDPFGERKVAIKVAHEDKLRDSQQGARSRKLFFNEAKVAGMLRHPNIIEVYDANVEGDVWYIVMEYVAGKKTLHSFCQPDVLLPIHDVVRIIFKCAKALEHAHRKGVVHRDIKPKNILLSQEREVKIGDFGIALLTHLDVTETQVHGYVGSPLYMSPEQMLEGAITNRSDIFSIGVVMYEMLTGRHPFVARSLPAIIHQITHIPHTPLREVRPDVPRVLQSILDRALRKDPAKRYQSCMDMVGDLSLVFDEMNLPEEEISNREKFNLIKELKFFREFDVAEIWEVITATSWEEYAVGADIFQAGELDNSFYIIVSGTVVVRKGERVVDSLERGDCFGESGFIAGKVRPVSIVAKTEVTVMKVRTSLMERTSLACQLRFHKVFLNNLIERLSVASDQAS